MIARLLIVSLIVVLVSSVALGPRVLAQAPAGALDGEVSPVDATAHIVRPGETLGLIAMAYGVSVDELVALNAVRDRDLIYVGQSLRLPAGVERMASASPVATDSGAADGCAQGDTLVPAGWVSVLVLGIEGDDAWRTDTIMLALLNPETGRAGLIGIPRDLYVTIPGHGDYRINTVDHTGEVAGYPGGGPGLLACVLADTLNLSFDHYVRVRYGGFASIIDAVDGVDVRVEYPLHDTLDDPNDGYSGYRLDLEPGIVHMDGAMALAYSRSRRTTSDLDRARRQQLVLLALLDKLRQDITLVRVPTLYRELSWAVTTDLSLLAAIRYGYYGVTVDSGQVQRLVLTSPYVYDWKTPEGAAVLLPEPQRLEAGLRTFIAGLNRPAE